MKKNAFNAWTTYVFMDFQIKIKYGNMTYDYSLQYSRKDDKYPNDLQEEVDVMRRVKFQPNKGTIRSRSGNSSSSETSFTSQEETRVNVLHVDHRNIY